ncbi:MAG TPA: aspartyl protease family protein [Flavisolibacter sp.]|nr:aspartyl protease family protein [Flavisolibacter sp.]
MIQGKPYQLLLDTGGGETFISPRLAKQLGKSIYGGATSFRMNGDRLHYQRCDSLDLKIGATTLRHKTVGVWDVMQVLPEGLPQLDGVLSLKSFEEHIISLDLSNHRLIFETSSTYIKKKKNMTVLQTRFASGMNGHELTLFLNIPKNNRSYWFLMDSGNLDDLLLSKVTAYDWGVLKDSTLQQRQNLDSITISLGQKVMASKASSKKIIYDGALNYALLSRMVFLIHFPKKQVSMR